MKKTQKFRAGGTPIGTPIAQAVDRPAPQPVPQSTLSQQYKSSVPKAVQSQPAKQSLTAKKAALEADIQKRIQEATAQNPRLGNSDINLIRHYATTEASGFGDPRIPDPAMIKRGWERAQRRQMRNKAQGIKPYGNEWDKDGNWISPNPQPTGYKKGGSVRGCGLARKGHGKGTMK